MPGTSKTNAAITNAKQPVGSDRSMYRIQKWSDLGSTDGQGKLQANTRADKAAWVPGAVAGAPPRRRCREDAAALAAWWGGCCHGTGASWVQTKGQREWALLGWLVLGCNAEAAEEGASVSVLFVGGILLNQRRTKMACFWSAYLLKNPMKIAIRYTHWWKVLHKVTVKLLFALSYPVYPQGSPGSGGNVVQQLRCSSVEAGRAVFRNFQSERSYNE